MLMHGKYNLLLAVMALSACKAAPLDGPVDRVSTAGGISWEAFRKSAIVTRQGRYLVEGDLTFGSETALYRYWSSDIATADNALTVKQRLANGVNVDDVWTFPDNFALTYCIGSNFTSQQLTALVPALEAAGHAWSSRAGVSFQKVTVAAPVIQQPHPLFLTCSARQTVTSSQQRFGPVSPDRLEHYSSTIRRSVR